MNQSARPAVSIDLAGLAAEHLRHGRFAEAEALYRQLSELEPENAHCRLELSALLRLRREHSAADKLAHKAFKLERLANQDDLSTRQPRVWRTRCLDGGQYQVCRRLEGGYKTLFKGGHFSTTHLVNKDTISLSIVQIAEGELSVSRNDPLPALLINAIACADRSRRSLEALAAWLADRPQLPVINPPEAVLRTSRDCNFERLNQLDGVIFPRTRRIVVDWRNPSQARAIAGDGARFPLIVRSAGRHTGRETYLCEDVGELAACLALFERRSDVYIIEFADCRHADRLYRKARAFFIDGELYPVACLASDFWQIHSGDRYRIMADSEQLQAQERIYLRDPEQAVGRAAWQALRRVGQSLQLDFVGIDFTTTADGRLFLFEANPAMRHNFDHTPKFPYTLPNLIRISHAFDAMIHRRIGQSGAAHA